MFFDSVPIAIESFNNIVFVIDTTVEPDTDPVEHHINDLN